MSGPAKSSEIKCLKCPCTFETIHSLYLHFCKEHDNVHNYYLDLNMRKGKSNISAVTNFGKFLCSHCAFFGSNASDLSNHILTFHPKQIRFKCVFCTHGTHQQVSMINHVVTKHQDLMTDRLKQQACAEVNRIKSLTTSLNSEKYVKDHEDEVVCLGLAVSAEITHHVRSENNRPTKNNSPCLVSNSDTFQSKNGPNILSKPPVKDAKDILTPYQKLHLIPESSKAISKLELPNAKIQASKVTELASTIPTEIQSKILQMEVDFKRDAQGEEEEVILPDNFDPLESHVQNSEEASILPDHEDLNATNVTSGPPSANSVDEEDEIYVIDDKQQPKFVDVSQIVKRVATEEKKKEEIKIIPIRQRGSKRKENNDGNVDLKNEKKTSALDKCPYCLADIYESGFLAHLNVKHGDGKELYYQKIPSKNGNKNFECSFCRVHILTRKSVILHLVKKHFPKCGFCDVAVADQIILDEHVFKEHKGSKRMKESAVNFPRTNLLGKEKKIPAQENEIEIIDVSENSGENTYTCMYCSLNLNGFNSYRVHVTNEHPEESYVNLWAENNPVKNDWLKSVEKVGKHFSCKLCDFDKKTTSNIKNHVFRKHMNHKEFICLVCGIEELCQSAMKAHVKRHAKSRCAKPKKQCKNSSFKMNNGNKEKRTHEMPDGNFYGPSDELSCGEGKKKFFQNESTKHQKKSSQSKNWCSKCKFRAKSASELSNHFSRAHGLKDSSSNENDFENSLQHKFKMPHKMSYSNETFSLSDINNCNERREMLSGSTFNPFSDTLQSVDALNQTDNRTEFELAIDELDAVFL